MRTWAQMPAPQMLLPWLLILAYLCSSCARSESEPQRTGSRALDAGVQPMLPHRSEVVARADALAVRGHKAKADQRGQLLKQAADLRARIWRIERKEADALEALELYNAASEAEWAGACAAAVQRALLLGELRASPSRAFEALYVARKRFGGAECKSLAGRALEVLSAYTPLPAELAKLERQAKRNISGGSRDEPQELAATKQLGDPVVMPNVVERHEPARITNVERYGGDDAARVVVFVTHPSLFKVGYLVATGKRGPRLFVDIENTRYDGPLAFDLGGLIERVRLGKQANGTTRVVLDLRSDVYRKVFYMPEPFRLVIDVSKDRPQTSVRSADAGGVRAIRRVVLDPGHGGHDPGAVGATGLREKDVTLDIAHRAAPLIARELGISTLLTRDTDEFVPLDERAQRAKNFSADIFISIHCNASVDGRGKGIMTFVLDESQDKLASHIAARENAASPAAAAELANMMSRMLSEGAVRESAHFASLLQRAAVASLVPAYRGIVDHGVKRAGFYVLANAPTPAVLFEASFISHPLGEMRLNTGDYRQRMADSIVNAVRAYREGK